MPLSLDKGYRVKGPPLKRFYQVGRKFQGKIKRDGLAGKTRSRVFILGRDSIDKLFVAKHKNADKFRPSTDQIRPGKRTNPYSKTQTVKYLP